MPHLPLRSSHKELFAKQNKKETHIWIKRQDEGIFAIYASDKVLIPRTHKGFKQ